MAKGNEFGYCFWCLVRFIFDRSLVPSENFVPRYKENGGNGAFSDHGLPGFCP